MFLTNYNPSICFTNIIDWKSNKTVLFLDIFKKYQYLFVRIY